MRPIENVIVGNFADNMHGISAISGTVNVSFHQRRRLMKRDVFLASKNRSANYGSWNHKATALVPRFFSEIESQGLIWFRRPISGRKANVGSRRPPRIYHGYRDYERLAQFWNAINSLYAKPCALVIPGNFNGLIDGVLGNSLLRGDGGLVFTRGLRNRIFSRLSRFSGSARLKDTRYQQSKGNDYGSELQELFTRLVSWLSAIGGILFAGWRWFRICNGRGFTIIRLCGLEEIITH